MSLFINRSPRGPKFYLEKARSQIERTLLSYRLALHGVTSANAGSLLEAAGGVREGSSERREEKVREVLVKSHFILLKVNFELFLQLLSVAAWRVALKEHRDGAGSLSDKAQRRLFALKIGSESVLLHADPIEALCDAIVPRHGLMQLSDVLRETNLDITRAFNDADPAVWAQIATAFEVRHLIEHRNGLVDGSFRAAVGKFWPASTWGRRSDTPLAERERVHVTEGDLLETARAMTLALSALELLVRDLERRHDRALTGAVP